MAVSLNVHAGLCLLHVRPGSASGEASSRRTRDRTGLEHGITGAAVQWTVFGVQRLFQARLTEHVRPGEKAAELKLSGRWETEDLAPTW